jgi:hypothetical protein
MSWPVWQPSWDKFGKLEQRILNWNKIMRLKLRNRIVFVGKAKKTRRLVQITLVSFIALSGTSGAQQVVAPPPTVNVTPPAVLEAPNEMQVFPQENPISSFPDEVQPLRLGPVTLRPHVFYQFLYGSGIQSNPGQQHDTIVQTFAPGMLLVLSPRWTLDYTPTFTFYSDKSFQNNVGQSVTLTGGASYENWNFGLMQSFTYSSSPQVQTGTQTGQENYVTALTASAPLNSKMSVDLGVNQTLNFPDGFQSSREWSTLDWLNYEFWPRFTAGVGAGFGYVAASPDMVFEQFQGRIGWRATDKISLQSSIGVQFSQFTTGGESPLVNLIFGDTIQYQPFEHTKLSLGANQVVVPAYYQNQISVVTSVNGDLQQRLFGKFYLDVSAGYNWNNYIAAASGVTANSSADYYSVTVQLSTTFLKRGTVAVFYNYSDNITDQAGLAYTSNQVGFNIGYRY